MRRINKLHRSALILIAVIIVSAFGIIPASAEDYTYSPYQISKPTDIADSLINDLGLQFSVEVTDNSQYLDYIDNYGYITVPERGIIYYRAVNNSSWVSDMNLFYSSNKAVKTESFTYAEQEPFLGVYRGYYVEPGKTYYADIYYCNGGTGTTYRHYLYYLPVSSGISVKQTLSADKTYTKVSLQSPEQSHVTYSYVKGNYGWKDKDSVNWNNIDGSSFNCKENGTYTIRADWDGNAEHKWDDYTMLRTISVTGTQKAPKTYKVTFNPNGGTLTNKSQKTRNVTSGKEYGTFPSVTKKGYALKGWYTSKKGGSKVSSTSKCRRKITLYAHWKKKVSIKKATIKVASCTYNGQYQKPKVTVKYNKKTLKKGTDYTLSYKNNKKASKKAKVTVKGKGYYKDSITKTFTIKKKTAAKNTSGTKNASSTKNTSGTKNTSATNWQTRMDQFIKLAAYKNGATWGKSKAPLISKYGCKGCRAYAADFVAYVYGGRDSKSSPKAKFDSYVDAKGGYIKDITKIKPGDIVCDQENSNHVFVVLDIDWKTGKMTTAEGNVGKSGNKNKVRIGSNYYRIVKNAKGSYHLEEKFKDGWKTRKFNHTRHYGNVD